MTWDTPNGVRADTLNRQLLKKCKRTGCVYLIMGVESGDQNVLDRIIDKRLSLPKIIEVAEIASEVGIDLRSFFIIGFPGETREQIKRTVDFALHLYRRYRIQPNMMFATPLVGTRLYDISTRKGYLTGPVTPSALAVSTSRRGSIQTEHFDPDYLCAVRDRFDAECRSIRLRLFVKGVLRSPGRLLYIAVNALRDFSRIRKVCADTVMFYHFLGSRKAGRAHERCRSLQRKAVARRKVNSIGSNVA